MYQSEDKSEMKAIEARQALLDVLKQRLADLERVDGSPQSVPPAEQNRGETSEPGGTIIAPHADATGTQVGRGGTALANESAATGTEASRAGDVPPATETKPSDATADPFADLGEDLRETALHFQEKLKHRSPFARLTTEQRHAILDLLEDHTAPNVVKILAEPPPVGLSFKTSKQALSRFKRDYMKYEMKRVKDQNHDAVEQERKAADDAFQQACQSEQAFRQVTERNLKRRLFEATANPDSDHQKIRWLIKSLEMLRKTPNEKQ